MKKFAITICILGAGLASGAFASFQSEDVSTVPHLKGEGFSTEMTKVTDLVRYNHSNKTIEPYYDKDVYAGSTDRREKWYTTVKRWLDPAQDDGLFGRHEINYTNDWWVLENPKKAQDVEDEAVAKRRHNAESEMAVEEARNEQADVQDAPSIDVEDL